MVKSKNMIRFKFSLLIILILITSIDATNKSFERVNGSFKNDVFSTKTLMTGDAVPDSEVFVLQPEHTSNRLNGCVITSITANNLNFEFKSQGNSVMVLRANAPLIITGQSGLTARLRPGWDGTLGYSLYALEVEAGAIGSGTVCLAVEPVHTGASQTKAVFNERVSRFPETREAFLAWQQEWRNKLTSRLMNGAFPERVPLAAEVLSTEDHHSFTLRRVRYKTQNDRSNTLLISLPRNMSGRVPLLVALHGHEAKWGEADSAAYSQGHIDDFCAYFAERGWAVLQPATMNHSLQHAGWTLQGEWTWDAMVALDYASALAEIDTLNVMVCGLSTGGHLAMNMLALDNRVRAGIVGCVFSTWNHYRERMRIPPHCDCGILSQLGNWLEQCDWAALAAPKPVQFQHGRQDASFCPGADPALLNVGWNTAIMPVEEFDNAFAEVERAYRLAGMPENVQLHFHIKGHQVDNVAAYSFLSKSLSPAFQSKQIEPFREH